MDYVALSWGERGSRDLIIPEGINQGDTPRVPKAPKLIPEGWFKTESRVQLQTMTLPMGVIISHAPMGQFAKSCYFVPPSPARICIADTSILLCAPLTWYRLIWRHLKRGKAEVLKWCKWRWSSFFLHRILHWRWQALWQRLWWSATMVRWLFSRVLVLPSIKLCWVNVLVRDYAAFRGPGVVGCSLLLLLVWYQWRLIWAVNGVISRMGFILSVKATANLKLLHSFVDGLHG